MFNFTNQSGYTDYAPFLSLLGGGLSAGAQLAAASTSAQFMRANATIAGLQATSDLQAGASQAEVYRQRMNQTLGKQQAQIGGAGLTQSGSALRSLQTTASFGAQDMQRIQLNAARQAWGHQVTQQGDLVQANTDQAAGRFSALGSLITSSARAFGNWNTGAASINGATTSMVPYTTAQIAYGLPPAMGSLVDNLPTINFGQ